MATAAAHGGGCKALSQPRELVVGLKRLSDGRAMDRVGKLSDVIRALANARSICEQFMHS